jgi:hypothetical protein
VFLFEDVNNIAGHCVLQEPLGQSCFTDNSPGLSTRLPPHAHGIDEFGLRIGTRPDVTSLIKA